MLPKRLIKGFDQRGLRNLLLLIFLALAIPTVVLIWQAYSQLKWEAFHQQRGVAEELVARVGSRLNDMIRVADAQSFGDYAFLVVSGDPSANFVQRSPLSAFPVDDDIPGVLGYFQVDSAGVFSTPLLPTDGADANRFGISAREYAARLQVARQLQSILADNRLLRSRQDVGKRQLATAPAARRMPVAAAEQEANEHAAGTLVGLASSAVAENRAVDALEEIAVGSFETAKDDYSELAFDQLNQPQPDTAPGEDKSVLVDQDGLASSASGVEQRSNRVGKVSDLELDAALQKKSEDVDRGIAGVQSLAEDVPAGPGRSKRREQSALPEAVQFQDSAPLTNIAGVTDLRINTFESEIDPFDFSLLDSDHFVLFRKVWRDGERYTQGLLIARDVFIADVIGMSFVATALSETSNLIIAYHDDVIHSFSGNDNTTYSNVAADLSGALLLRSHPSAPFGSLELVFSIKQLPAGPGASVLGWVTLVLAIVFTGGFVTLYRLGMSQIRLARQQQDFVSAVSHELKSPLTSIRMYGEMLKEGWADEEKRQSYYEFIHDESERLSRLISNVLQLASITRNEPQFDIGPMTVAELMSNTESKISNQIERAGFKLTIKRDADADKASVNMDEDCFAQIIINLVDNAIKFSKNADNKAIEISSRLSGGDQILFSVRDHGPGIEKDQMKQIFQLFYRSESELTRETVGTGIGLAIVHQLTAAMNGHVDLVNAVPGAEFKLRFPVVSQRT